ncbi:hypothetical protein KR054_008591, partial [Drosophila jambulina]
MVEVKEHPLDNCQLFVQLRNLFQAYDSQTKRLATFLYWSGNERHIDELCTQVVQLLVEHELVTQRPHSKRPEELQTLPTGPEAISHLRGVLILLLVNTEADSQSPWSLQCQHLCQQLPQLPQFLTVAIAMRCGLQQPLLEFLECGPRWATIQYYGSLNEALAHGCPNRMDALTWISGTLKAAGRSDVADTNQTLVREMARMLQRHLLDSAERLRELRPTARKVYLAKAMEILLEVLLEVLEPPGKPAYFNTYNSLSPESDHQPTNQTNLKRDPKPLANILMNALQRIVEMVTVDIFLYWMEISSPWTLYNYQTLICHQSAAVIKAVKPYPELSKHEVCGQLGTFGQSALTFEDILAGMSIGELLAFLDGDSGPVTNGQLLLGLECLLQRSIAMGNDECVETMAKHVGLLGTKHAKVILTHLGQVAEARKAMLDIKVEPMEVEEESDEEEQEEYANLLHLVLLPIFTSCRLQDKILLLQFRDELGISKSFPFAAPNLQERRIRFFNNLNGRSRAVEHQLLIFFFEDPEESWLALAKLAMAHSRFSAYFWHMAKHCAAHSVHQMAYLASQLLTDDDALLKGNASSFLYSLYVHPLVLNGLIQLRANVYRVSLRHDILPYSQEQLRAAQSDFLQACADGLNEFAASLNFTPLRRILQLLKQLEAVEQEIQASGRRQLLQLRRECRRNASSEEAVVQAMHYVEMHQYLPKWRQAHIPLITQLLATIDALRWDLTSFNWERVDLLGEAVKYWRENTHNVMFLDAGELQRCKESLCPLNRISSIEFRQKLEECAAGLQHQEFLSTELPPPEDPNYGREFIHWVTQASASEATTLFRQSIESRTDCVLFFELAKAVEQANCKNANEAYIFLFGCHVNACIGYTRGRKSSPRKQELGQRLASIVGGSPKETLPEVRE